MIHLKTLEEIAILKEGGEILSRILTETMAKVEPGITTGDLDAFAEEQMRAAGGEPSFKGYKGAGDEQPFPSTVCTSINHEVVHGIASFDRALKVGELLKMDIGMWYKGLCTDMAVTVPVGKVSKEAYTLMNVTKEALEIGVSRAVVGGWIADIGKAVDKHVRKHGFSTVKDLCGHGVGHHVHEDPRIPNFLDRSMDPVKIEPGMVLALEPMVNAGDDAIRLLGDGWTIVTADKGLSAHFEVTLAITEHGTELITPYPG